MGNSARGFAISIAFVIRAFVIVAYFYDVDKS